MQPFPSTPAFPLPAGCPSRQCAAVVLSLVAALGFATRAHAEVVLTTSVAHHQGAFAHPFTFVNDFWPKSVPADYKQKHPFLEYHSIFNAFGSNPSKRSEHELYDETTAYPHYQFQRLTNHIDTVLAAGLKPYLTLGSCPIDLASNQTVGFYNTMTHGARGRQVGHLPGLCHRVLRRPEHQVR